MNGVSSVTAFEYTSFLLVFFNSKGRRATPSETDRLSYVEMMSIPPSFVYMLANKTNKEFRCSGE
jgi:hypothetical protein